MNVQMLPWQRFKLPLIWLNTATSKDTRDLKCWNLTSKESMSDGRPRTFVPLAQKCYFLRKWTSSLCKKSTSCSGIKFDKETISPVDYKKYLFKNQSALSSINIATLNIRCTILWGLLWKFQLSWIIFFILHLKEDISSQIHLTFSSGVSLTIHEENKCTAQPFWSLALELLNMSNRENGR